MISAWVWQQQKSNQHNVVGIAVGRILVINFIANIEQGTKKNQKKQLQTQIELFLQPRGVHTENLQQIK